MQVRTRITRQIPPFCFIEQRVQKEHSGRTLSDVLGGHNTDYVGGDIDNDTRDVTLAGAKEVGKWGGLEHMETFIISKGPNDKYFKSNPPWIARYVVTKFRNLLIKLKDELICIDMTLKHNNKRTIAYSAERDVSSAEQVNSKQDMFSANKLGFSVFESLNFRSAVLGAPTMPKWTRGTSTISKDMYRLITRRKVNAPERGDRQLILRTLHQFPFEHLNPHTQGEIRFLEALRYFQHELKCDVVRNWVEEGTNYAELRVPAYSVGTLRTPLGMRDPTVPEAFDRKLRAHLRNLTPAAATIEHWFGDFVKPHDLTLGSIRDGVANNGKIWGGLLGRHSSVPKSARPWTKKSKSKYWANEKYEGPATLKKHLSSLHNI
eukprot:TRINITY_DN9184_c0_g1_i1.p1 TRINITY_DN9184_c0_g1~~TRINITY_DN9184_c0_g1_i1.p1  ORF type:complete len:376 (+),score=51.42 TRINITY_DN9184_c0_g1_i1:691-1818(+)